MLLEIVWYIGTILYHSYPIVPKGREDGRRFPGEERRYTSLEVDLLMEKTGARVISARSDEEPTELVQGTEDTATDARTRERRPR